MNQRSLSLAALTLYKDDSQGFTTTAQEHYVSPAASSLSLDCGKRGGGRGQTAGSALEDALLQTGPRGARRTESFAFDLHHEVQS